MSDVLDFLITVGLFLAAMFVFTACMSNGDRARTWPVQVAWSLAGFLLGGVILVSAVAR